MKVKSLGYQTDLLFSEFDGEITDRDTYLVIVTPDNPSYYWGNFLLFADPPRQGDVVHISEETDQSFQSKLTTDSGAN